MLCMYPLRHSLLPEVHLGTQIYRLSSLFLCAEGVICSPPPFRLLQRSPIIETRRKLGCRSEGWRRLPKKKRYIRKYVQAWRGQGWQCKGRRLTAACVQVDYAVYKAGRISTLQGRSEGSVLCSFVRRRCSVQNRTLKLHYSACLREASFPFWRLRRSG